MGNKIDKVVMLVRNRNKNLIRKAIDLTLAIYEGSTVDSGGRPLKSEKFPSDRAKALCVVNPLTFKKQDRDGLLTKIIKCEYDSAVSDYLSYK